MLAESCSEQTIPSQSPFKTNNLSFVTFCNVFVSSPPVCHYDNPMYFTIFLKNYNFNLSFYGCLIIVNKNLLNSDKLTHWDDQDRLSLLVLHSLA